MCSLPFKDIGSDWRAATESCQSMPKVAVQLDSMRPSCGFSLCMRCHGQINLVKGPRVKHHLPGHYHPPISPLSAQCGHFLCWNTSLILLCCNAIKHIKELPLVTKLIIKDLKPDSDTGAFFKTMSHIKCATYEFWSNVHVLITLHWQYVNGL